MYEHLPLPPNWESRFDPSTQQWFFVDHVNKKTSWDDPRPAYYSARQKRNSVSNDHSVTEVPSPTVDTSYASLGSDYGKVTTSSPQPDESEERDEQFMEYLQALRAAYPECKDRQLAKLMEKWLGDSPSLRKFVATYMKRKVSGSSEATTKRASSTSSEKIRAGSLKHSDAPRPVLGYEEIGDRPLPTSAPISARRESHSSDPRPSTSNTTKPPVATGTASSASNAGTPKTDTCGSKLSSPCAQPAPDSVPVTSMRTKKKDSLVEHETNSLEQSTVKEHSQSSRSFVTRCTPHGPNPQLRGPRVVARGPDPQLARGPDRSLCRGPDKSLLLRGPRAAWTGSFGGLPRSDFVLG